MLYDNVSVAEYTPPTAATFEFSADFESNDNTQGAVIPGWSFFGAGPGYGYGPFDLKNSFEQAGNIATGEGGAAQGTQYLNAFNDYTSPEHINSTGNPLTISVFRQFAIGADESGSYQFKVDAKLPSQFALASPATGKIFVKRLDPLNDYAETILGEVDAALITDAEWQTFTINFDVDSATEEGQLLQFGFSTTAKNGEDSGVLYDNVSVSRAAQ